uniref:Uncharacterized protein n=1 Tax=Quercus lobata TaxID=97700 RepID=A0A7N2LT82_QUELO
MKKMKEMNEKKEENKKEEMKRKKNEQKREKEKHQDGSGAGKTKKERRREAPVNEEGKKQGCLDPASVLTPNTLDDVQLMEDTGLEAYRFSISWSRLIPNGRGAVNPKGLQYYNKLINELISHGIQPHVTLHHTDLPQALEDEYGGWVSRKIVKDFTAYADVCFRKFGDRISYWTTMNEANVFVLEGYDTGFLPPQRCPPPYGGNCSTGNSSTEPYMAAHHILLAHASAARLYKKRYQDKQHGVIGLNVFSYWFIPLTNSTEDKIATQRANDFFLGWFVDPLVFGDYPQTMKKIVGSRLPSFTYAESSQVKGSFDFIGVNHYITMYVNDNPSSLNMEDRDVLADMAVQFTSQRTRCNSTLEDWPRVKYLHAYIGSLLDALRQIEALSDIADKFKYNNYSLLQKSSTLIRGDL